MNEFIDLLPAQQRNEAEHWYGGTGDAIFQNMDIIKRYRAKYIIILAGDHIYKMDYAKMLLDHVDKGAKCTVACIEYPLQTQSISEFWMLINRARFLSLLKNQKIQNC